MKSFIRSFHEKMGKKIQIKGKSTRLFFILLGIASTIWFLIHVIPKPQRASYPCMRTAAPIMSGFVIYILSLSGSMILFKNAYNKIRNARYLSALTSILLCITLIIIFGNYISVGT